MISKPKAVLAALIPFLLSASPDVPIQVSHDLDAAKIRFIDKLDHGWIDLYPEDDCNNGINLIRDRTTLVDALKSFAEEKPKRVDMIDPPDATDWTVVENSFKAGQTINLGMGRQRFRHCLGGVSFVAAPSTQYEVTLFEQPPGKCTANVTILTVKDGAVHRTPLRDRRRVICKSAN